MEVIYITVTIVNFFAIFLLYKDLKTLSKNCGFIRIALEQSHQQISELIQLSSTLKQTQEPTRPTRANNWDSMREAFKVPIKAEVNERN